MAASQQGNTGDMASAVVLSAEAKEREREIHDALAARQSPDRPLTVDRFEHQFEQALLDWVDLRPGHRVLELGCGDGELTLQLIDRGAEVTGLDLSPGMVELAARRVERHRPFAKAHLIAADAENTGLESSSFDAIVGKWVLHHVDIEQATREIKRLLRPNGVAVFIENSQINPLLRFARNRLAGRFGFSKWGTPDEHPFTAQDFELLRRNFAEVKVDAPVFTFFQLLGWHVANGGYPKLIQACRRLDHAVAKLVPRVGKYSYCVRIWIREP